jgi:amidophosphoribosyltransferase
VRYPNVYGIDMPAASELIANSRDVDEIAALIGADKLIYQDLHGLIRSVRHDNSVIEEFDASCFSGEYVTGDVTEQYLQNLEKHRNDRAKQAREERQRGFAAPDDPATGKRPKPAVGM